MTGGRTEGTGEGMVLALNKKRGAAASETVVALIMVSSTRSALQVVARSIETGLLCASMVVVCSTKRSLNRAV